jgi:hypothetical protein
MRIQATQRELRGSAPASMLRSFSSWRADRGGASAGERAGAGCRRACLCSQQLASMLRQRSIMRVCGGGAAASEAAEWRSTCEHCQRAGRSSAAGSGQAEGA